MGHTKAAALLVIGFATPASAQDAGELAMGQWARGDGVARVVIARCGGRICVTNTWIREGTTGENAGDRLVLDVKPAGAGGLTGSAYDPKRKLTYSIALAVGGDSMTTTGCILRLMCKEVAWTRIK